MYVIVVFVEVVVCLSFFVFDPDVVQQSVEVFSSIECIKVRFLNRIMLTKGRIPRS